ncbi:MAG: hypothetical protein ACJAVK_003132 [Akkermansiaceae bacterium]
MISFFKNTFISTIAIVAFSVLNLSAQAAKVAHRAEIKKISAQVQETPQFQVSGPKDKPITPRYWIEIEAEIEVKTTDPSGFIPEFQANWFAVIQDKTTDKSIRLDGKCLFKNLRTTDKKVIISAYIEPDTLERFTGKSKPSVADIEAFALTISGADIVSDGKYAEGIFDATVKKEAKWWVKWAHRTEAGLIVAKSKTPFAPLWTDRYPTEKAENRSF